VLDQFLNGDKVAKKWMVKSLKSIIHSLVFSILKVTVSSFNFIVLKVRGFPHRSNFSGFILAEFKSNDCSKRIVSLAIL
jgi:hypothetical protein